MPSKMICNIFLYIMINQYFCIFGFLQLVLYLLIDFLIFKLNQLAICGLFFKQISFNQKSGL